MKSKILVIGSINTDIVLKSDRFPKPGESYFGESIEIIPGGKGANAALTVQRLGVDTVMVGKVGNDLFAETALKNLKSDGVNMKYIFQDKKSHTGLAVIIVTSSGENSIFVYSGANMNLSFKDIDKLDNVWKECSIVLTSFEIPLEIVEYALDKAHMNGLKVLVDAGPATACPESVLKKVDILSPNETEAEALTGVCVKDLYSAKRASKKFIKIGIPTVVLKLGEKGSLLYSNEEIYYSPAYKVTSVDTTAAGDAFTGAFAVAVHNGKSLKDALRFANFAGAFSVTKIGAQTSLPYKEELEDFMKRFSK